jgi:hypothetical protein
LGQQREAYESSGAYRLAKKVHSKGVISKGIEAFFWQEKKPCYLCWVEALVRGNPNIKAEFRVIMFAHDPPSTKPVRENNQTAMRYSA